MKINNSYSKSKKEEEYYLYLCNRYGRDNIKRQYYDPFRYPFHCDFYVELEDLFIECNFHWTHGSHPFDKNNPEDIKILNEWKENAKTSNFYQRAIYVWTDLDIRKLNLMKSNHLNYQFIY